MDRRDTLTPIHAFLWKLGLAGAVVLAPMVGFLLWTTGRLQREWSQAQEEAARATASEAGLRRTFQELSDIKFALDQSAIVAITDPKGLIRYANDKFCAISQYSRDELLGQDHRLLNSGYHSKEYIRTQWRTIANGKVWKGEFRNRAKDGSFYWVDTTIVPFLNEAGKPYQYLAIRFDITERKQAEIDLGIAKEAAEGANRAKSEFLASMSHEIRTPMNAIIGMADLLWETPLSVDQREYVRIFRGAGDTLLSLINDVLDFSKVEAGHLTLETVDFDLHELIDKTAEMVAVRAHAKGLELVSHIAADVSSHLVGDPNRLRQILVNLIGNAIKFTEKGEVVVEVKQMGDDGQPTSSLAPDREVILQFSVRDTGIGIPSDKVDAVFEKFTQADSSTTRKYGGTGLGLTISKRLVELMGGCIGVASTVGRGSVFSFTARVGLWAGPKRRVARTPVDLKNLNVLVVDDNETNRLILREMLTGWHARVTEAAGGEEALEKICREREAGNSYQLVLLDCRMPAMDGFQVAESLKEGSRLTGTVLMMLTSDARSGDMARARELGMVGYLVKPIKRAELLKAITAALGQAGAAAQGHAQAPDRTLAEDACPLKILLVDDSADNRLLVLAYLKRHPYQIESAEDGLIAVEKFQAGRFDLVLMDMQMPVMDGYAATRAIRQWEKDQGVPLTPIIALTAHALKEDEQKSLDAGCSGHLTKPIKKTALLKAIAEHTKGVPACGT
jgi:PAS domain S-box-containing protein